MQARGTRKDGLVEGVTVALATGVAPLSGMLARGRLMPARVTSSRPPRKRPALVDHPEPSVGGAIFRDQENTCCGVGYRAAR